MTTAKAMTNLILTAIETDTNLRTTARDYTGDNSFVFYRNKADKATRAEHLTVVPTIQLDEWPFATIDIKPPLHILLGLPTTSIHEIDHGHGALCFRDVMEYSILGYVVGTGNAAVEAIQDIAEAVRKAMYDIDYNLLIEVPGWEFYSDPDRTGTINFAMRVTAQKELAT